MSFCGCSLAANEIFRVSQKSPYIDGRCWFKGSCIVCCPLIKALLILPMGHERIVVYQEKI